MLRKLRCLVNGHTADIRIHNNVSIMRTPRQVSHNPITGELRIIEPIVTGAMYVGFRSTCTRCGCEYDSTMQDHIPTLAIDYKSIDTYV